MLLERLKDTFFLRKKNSVSETRRNHYVLTLWVVIGVHIIGLITIAICVIIFDEYHGVKHFLATVSEYLHYVAFISGLFLFILSLKSEVLVSQTHEFSSRTTQALSHQFVTFKEHLEWINEHISPSRFESHYTNLVLTLSTPLYGIGVGKEEATIFLDYFESWVENFEKIKIITLERPTIELAVWDKSENIDTFVNNYLPEENALKLELIDRYSVLLDRLMVLRKKDIIYFHLYFTERSDARLFMAHTQHSTKFAGLFAIFTPLNTSAVKKIGWTLAGFSFWEEKAFNDVYKFNTKLTNRNYEDDRIDHINLLKNPKLWLLGHYNLKGNDM